MVRRSHCRRRAQARVPSDGVPLLSECRCAAHRERNASVNGFIDQVAHHASGLNDRSSPWSKVFHLASRTSPVIRNWKICSESRDDGEPVTSLTSDTAIAFCMSFLQRLDVDWKLHGFDS